MLRNLLSTFDFEQFVYRTDHGFDTEKEAKQFTERKKLKEGLRMNALIAST